MRLINESIKILLKAVNIKSFKFENLHKNCDYRFFYCIILIKFKILLYSL